MSNSLTEARRKYIKHVRADGVTIYHCGDEVAVALLDRTPEEVAALADKICREVAGYHAQRYDHLNPGQVRMNSSNRIRGALRAAEGEELTRIRGLLK
ncbi:MAG: hypothetical protein ACOYB3_03885 [Azonexus sp.]